jgi:hypothetical protein
MNELQAYANSHEDEEILSIQTFACHGMIISGCQAVVVNKKLETTTE